MSSLSYLTELEVLILKLGAFCTLLLSLTKLGESYSSSFKNIEVVIPLTIILFMKPSFYSTLSVISTSFDSILLLARP